MKNILFIGGAGFIGSNLLSRFVESQQYNIFVYEPAFAILQRLEDYKKDLTVIRGTLGETDLLFSVLESHKIDVVVHLASTLVPGSSYEDYTNEYKNIVFPTIRLLTYCADSGIKFVFFSSGGTIYGNSVLNQMFKEDDKPAPISYYGLTKLNLENSIYFEHRRKGLQYLILRPSNPYGAGQLLHGKQGFIAVAIGKILLGDDIEIWGDGASMRDYIYIDDLADSCYYLIDNNILNEVINIGCGKGYSLAELISVLKNVVKEPVNVVYKPSRGVDVNAMILDNTKLKSYMNFHHTPIRKGVEMFYEYIKEKISNK